MREELVLKELSLEHGPEFMKPRDLARKYNSQYWDHQHRMKEDYVVVF